MRVKGEHETENAQNGKKYHKIVYWCEIFNDTATTETPYKQV